MSVRLTSASAQFLSRASAPSYNADYTAMVYFRLTTTSVWHGLIGLYGNGSNFDLIEIDNSNHVRLFEAVAGSFTINQSGSGTLTTSQDYCIALVRSGSDLTA